MKSQPQPPERRELHDPADPASVIRDAEIPYGGTENQDALSHATRRLLETLAHEEIPHLIVGALAMLQYVEGRTTRDIDLIIATDDARRLPDFVLEESNEWFATGTCGQLRVDLLFTRNPFFARFLSKHSAEHILLGQSVRCATPEGIILLKLFALPSLYRQGKIQRAALYESDIRQLLIHQPLEIESLLFQLQPHISPSDINSLRQILTDLQHQIDHRHKF